MDRPDKLPFSATFVVWASRAPRGGLTLGEKVAWYHTWGLDNSPEGCFMSHASLADRLGMEIRSVEELRNRLRRLGLMLTIQRGEGTQPGWRSMLPDQFQPPPKKGAGVGASVLAEKLDAWLREKDPGRNTHCPSTTTVVVPAPVAEVAALGGRGESPTSSSSEAQLPPAVTSKQDGGEEGVRGRARKARGEKADSEQLGMPALQLQKIEGGASPADWREHLDPHNAKGWKTGS